MDGDGKAARRPRRALHAVRRVRVAAPRLALVATLAGSNGAQEEIGRLAAQLEVLEARMRALQRRAAGLADHPEAASDAQAAFARRVLRANVQRQQLAAAPTLRLLSEYSLFVRLCCSCCERPVEELMMLTVSPLSAARCRLR